MTRKQRSRETATQWRTRSWNEKPDWQSGYGLDMDVDSEEEVGEEGIETGDRIGMPVEGGAEGKRWCSGMISEGECYW